MQFTTHIFLFAFAPIAILVYWLTPARIRLYWLIVASFAFYAYWDWRFSLLMLAIAAVDFTAGSKIELYRGCAKHLARFWLIVSLATNLGLLAAFKYAGFFAHTSNAIVGYFGGGALPIPELALPLGISFFTFRSLTYTLDLYKGRCAPAKSFVHYLAFVSFFPELVAGPIDRHKDLAPQIDNPPAKLTVENLNLGLVFFAMGLVKKVLVADRIAYYSEPLWSDAAHLTTVEAWAAVLGYTLQIYYDFAGYSLMALGVGCLLGMKLPQNFNSPYRARDIGDFWRRWHMSLSFWFRDYVFFNIGGMNVRLRWTALFLTMTLCGLWHGAAWTFVVWGMYHGAMLIVHHWLRERKLRWKGGWFGILGTLVLVIAGWVTFRAPSLPLAGAMYAKMLGLTSHTAGGSVPGALIVLTVVGMAWAVFAPNMYEYCVTKALTPKRGMLVLLGLLAAAAVLVMADSAPFLYSQF